MEDFKIFSEDNDDFVFDVNRDDVKDDRYDDFKLFTEASDDLSFDQGDDYVVKEKPGCLLLIMSFFVTIIAASSTFFLGFLLSRNVAYSVGQTIMPFVLSGVVVFIFQIGKSFRNNKSRLKIYSWTMLISFFSSIFNFIQMLSGGM